MKGIGPNGPDETRQYREPEKHAVRPTRGAIEAETQATVTAVEQLKLQRAFDHPGKHRRQQNDQHETHQRRKLQRRLNPDQSAKGDQAAFQNRDRIAVIIKARSGERGIAIKVLHLAHLGPGGIDAKRDDSQGDVDNPNTEIFRAFAAENKWQRGGLIVVSFLFHCGSLIIFPASVADSAGTA